AQRPLLLIHSRAVPQPRGGRVRAAGRRGLSSGEAGGDQGRPGPPGRPRRGHHRAGFSRRHYWAPQEGRFAVGLHSVRGLFAAAAADPREYVDLIDGPAARPWWMGETLRLNLFDTDTALDYRLAPRWTLRLAAPYAVNALRPALLYETRAVTAAVTFYAGLGAELTASSLAPYAVAGARLIDSLLNEYRPPLAGANGGGASVAPAPSGAVNVGRALRMSHVAVLALVDDGQNSPGLLLQQFPVSTGFHVEPEQGLGIGFAHVEAPALKFHAQAVRAVDDRRFPGVAGFDAGQGAVGVLQLAVDLAADRVAGGPLGDELRE